MMPRPPVGHLRTASSRLRMMRPLPWLRATPMVRATQSLCAIALGASIVAGITHRPGATIATDFALAAALAGAATVAYRAARRVRGTRQRLVVGLTVAAGCAALGLLVLAVQTLALGGQPPFPSLADALLLAAQGALLLGIASALGRLRGGLAFETFVDGMLLTAAAAIVIVQLDYAPGRLMGLGSAAHAFSVIWQLCGAGALVLLAILLAWRGELLGSRMATGLALGTVGMAVAGAYYVRDALMGSPVHGIAGALLALAVAGYASGLDAPAVVNPALSGELPRMESEAARVRAVAIVAAILIAAGSAAAVGLRPERNPSLALAVAAFGVLLALRAGHALRSQQRTTEALESTVSAEREISGVLEQRVALRARELAEAHRVLQRMWTLAQQVALELQSDRVLQRYVEAVVDVTRADGGAVVLVTEGARLQVAAATGITAALAGGTLPLATSASGTVVRQGECWRAHDVGEISEEGRVAEVAALVEHGVRGAMVLPLQRRGERIGAVLIATRAARHFSDLEAAHVEAMSDLTSVALANAALLETLRRAEWRFRTLFRAAPDAVLTVLESGRILEANDAVTDLSGVHPIQLVGRTLEEFVVIEDRERLRSALARALDGAPARAEVRMHHRDTLRTASLAARLLPEADPPTVLFVARDVTAEREMRSRLAETERLAAVGELVAGVAHEVNNPLSTISAFAQLLLRERSLPTEQRESVEVIHAEAVRAGQVLRDLLTFARRSEGERQPVDVNELVERTVRLRSFDMTSRGITCETDLTPSLPPTVGDARQLQQVLLNLIVNAVQAMASGPGGALRIATRAGEGHVAIEVTDSGPGIPEPARAHLFEPFFTTKSDGTGLGLSVSYGIITAHGGTIAVADTSSAGSTFRMTLPAAGDGELEAATREMPAASVRSPLRGKRILFADDEPSLRSGMAAFARLRRFSVVTAEDGASALAAARLGDFDAIICDLRMPGMSGPELYESLSAERPELAARMLFITGDVAGGVSRGFVEATEQPVLTKPFDFDRLEEELAALVGRCTAPAVAS